MSETAVEDLPAATVKKGGKAVKAAGGKKKKSHWKATHPPTSEMVVAALKDLKEHNGSSLQAIKKYISLNYFLDAEKISFYIRKYIKAAVDAGTIVQTKGKGASGSFKMAAGGERKLTAKPRKATSQPAVKSDSTVTPRKNVARSKKTKKPPTTPKVPKPKKGKSATPKVKPLKAKGVKTTKKGASKKK
ncbi:histone H1-like [Rhodnius prolixus]|uniref:Putative histone h1b n=2 Tax=Rhodnius TaxID=13248 RepID=R4G825_RHOPR